MATIIKNTAKKTRNRVTKFWSSIIAFFLGLSGIGITFTGCEYGPPPGTDPVFYELVEVRGTITDQDTFQPIKGIRVRALDEYGSLLNNSDAFSDDDGEYLFTIYNSGENEVILRYEDVDGIDNGSYSNADESVTVSSGATELINDVELDD